MSLLPTPERKAFVFDSDPFGTGKVGTVQPTSVRAYRSVVVPRIADKQQAVLNGLALWEADGNSPPTSGELVDFMVKRGMAKDCNSVRPRLNELVNLGLLVRGAERRCQSGGNKSATWYRVEAK